MDVALVEVTLQQAGALDMESNAKLVFPLCQQDVIDGIGEDVLVTAAQYVGARSCYSAHSLAHVVPIPSWMNWNEAKTGI